MSTLGDRVRERAKLLHERAGKVITFRRVAYGTGPNPTRTPTDYTVTAAIQSVRFDKVDGTLVQAMDLVVQIAAASLPVTPLTSDILIIDGVEKRIINVAARYAADTIAFWVLQAR